MADEKFIIAHLHLVINAIAKYKTVTCYRVLHFSQQIFVAFDNDSFSFQRVKFTFSLSELQV